MPQPPIIRMSHHSTDSELRQLWLGRLPAPQIDRIRRHLSRCEECLGRLIETDDQINCLERPADSSRTADHSQTAVLVR